VLETHVAWTSGRPAPGLAEVVDRYVAYELAGFEPGIHFGVPSARPTFIVSVGPPIDVVVQVDPTKAPARYGAVLGGLQAASAQISHDGNQFGVAIELSPVGFRRLFGLPSAALWSTAVELDEVLGGLGRELWERVQQATTWPARFEACDAVLLRALRAAEVVPELRRAWALVVGTGGTVGVASLATEVGWSRQHLTKRFETEFGLTPKRAGRIVRFERAYRMLQQTPSFVTIAQVAAVCGYYDQAHLDRDFVEFTGLPPTQLLAHELPNVQVGGAVVGAC
jgi:AraC-like DNA-binding protein